MLIVVTVLHQPDSQQDIRDYIDIYQTGELHPSGYHFAINVDISMFRLYSADYNANSSTTAATSAVQKKLSAVPGCETTLSISQPLHPADSSNTGAEDTNPLLVQTGQNNFLSVAVRAGKDVVLTAVTVDKVGYKAASHADVLLPAEASQWLLANQGDVSLVYAASGCDSLLIMNSAGRVMQVAYELHAGEVSVLATQPTSLPAELLTAPVHHLVGQDLNVGIEAENNWYALTASSVLTLSGLQSSKGNSLGQMVFTTQFSATLNAPTTGDVTSAKMVYLDDASTASMVIFCAQGLTVYAAELTLADIDTSASTDTVQNILKWQTVSVGKNIQLSVAGAGSDRALLLATDSGFCYNSHGHNTRAYPMVCASTPVPTETVLDYSLGLAAHWLGAIRGPTSTSTSAVATSGKSTDTSHIATSCSSTILHGSYSQGHRPAVVLDAQSQPGAHFFVETHEGVPTGAKRVGSRGGGECGDPIHHDGLVLNSFEVASWLDNVKRFYNVGAV